jgi:hypothetical protein
MSVCAAWRCSALRVESGQCVGDGLAQEIMPERQLCAGVDKELSAQQLIHSAEESGWREVEHRRQPRERERAADDRRDLRSSPRVGRHPEQPISHPVAHAHRQAVIGKLGLTGGGSHQAVLDEAAQ